MDALLQLAAPWLAPLFSLWGSPVTGIELVAVVLSVAMVVCNIRVNPLGWPLAIASSLLYALLFASVRLYGEASLQLLFVAVAAWGWWSWLQGRDDDGTPLRVHRLSRLQRWRALGITLAVWPALGQVLARTTDSDVPFLDALPTVASVTGQLLLGRKLVENWPVWVAVNVFSVGLFAYKGLWLTTALYLLFALMALAGWKAWHQRLAPEPR